MKSCMHFLLLLMILLLLHEKFRTTAGKGSNTKKHGTRLLQPTWQQTHLHEGHACLQLKQQQQEIDIYF